VLPRRRFIGQALAALAAGCARPDSGAPSSAATVEPPSAASTGATTPRLKLLANHFPNLCNVGVRVARDRGYFAAEGLDVDLHPVDLGPGHEHSNEWLTGPNGPMRADLIMTEYPSLVDLASGRMDFYIVGGEHSGCKQLIVPARSVAQTLSDMNGKRLGLPSSGQDRLIWEYLARQAGVDAQSLKWVPVAVPLGGTEELAFVRREFAAGNLDAYAASDPAGEILVSEGVARRLVSNTWTSPLNAWYCCMIALRRSLVDAHTDLGRRVMRAFRQSAAFIQRNPGEAVDLSIKGGYMASDTPRDICARLLAEYVWTGTGRIEEDLERYFQLLIQAGRIPASASPRDLVARVYRSAEA
jgi:NitT/TauT family transport system substrate-binding protein